MNLTLLNIFNHGFNYTLLNVIIIGLIGNFFVFKIFAFTKLKKCPISIYFRAIAIFDSIMFIEAVLSYARANFDFKINEENEFFCKFKIYFFFATGPISPWIIIVVSIDRFLSIAFPKKFLFMHKSRTQIILVCIVVIYNYAFYSYFLWNYTIISGKSLNLINLLFNVLHIISVDYIIYITF